MTNMANAPETSSDHAQSASDAPEVYLTLTEAIDRYQVSRTTLRRRLADGAIEGASRSSSGRGSWLVPLIWMEDNYETVAGPDHVGERSENDPVVLAEERQSVETRDEAAIGAAETERERLTNELARARCDLEATHTALERAESEHRQQIDQLVSEAAENKRRLEEAIESRDGGDETASRSLADEGQAGRSYESVVGRSRRAALSIRDQLNEAQTNARRSYNEKLRNRDS